MNCVQVMFLLKYKQPPDLSVSQPHLFQVISQHIKQASDDGTTSADEVFQMITIKT